jgi:hypothetical protein
MQTTKRQKVSKLPSSPQDEDPSETTRQGHLIFEPSPSLEEGEDIQLAAANKQAKLMKWHYHLGHLSVPKLKQLALNGKIPKIPAKVVLPKCTGCLF